MFLGQDRHTDRDQAALRGTMLTISVLVLGVRWMILVTMIMVVVVVVVLIVGYDAHHLSSGVRRWQIIVSLHFIMPY